MDAATYEAYLPYGYDPPLSRLELLAASRIARAWSRR